MQELAKSYHLQGLSKINCNNRFLGDFFLNGHNINWSGWTGLVTKATRQGLIRKNLIKKLKIKFKAKIRFLRNFI